MTTARIYTDERYPDYQVLAAGDDTQPMYELDVDDATIDRWRRAASEYYRAQAEIEALIDQQRPESRTVHDVR